MQKSLCVCKFVSCLFNHPTRFQFIFPICTRCHRDTHTHTLNSQRRASSSRSYIIKRANFCLGKPPLLPIPYYPYRSYTHTHAKHICVDKTHTHIYIFANTHTATERDFDHLHIYAHTPRSAFLYTEFSLYQSSAVAHIYYPRSPSPVPYRTRAHFQLFFSRHHRFSLPPTPSSAPTPILPLFHVFFFFVFFHIYFRVPLIRRARNFFITRAAMRQCRSNILLAFISEYLNRN